MATATRHSLNLKEHCLICLRHQDISWIQNLHIINTIDNFQPLVCYLIGAPHNLNHVAVKPQFSVPKLKNCPPLCAECYHLLSELNRLHRQMTEIQRKIEKQTGLIRNMVKKTIDTEKVAQTEEEEEEEDEQDKVLKEETLLDTFLRNINSSGMPQGQTAMVSNFVKGFHHQITRNAPIQFPLYLPRSAVKQTETPTLQKTQLATPTPKVTVPNMQPKSLISKPPTPVVRPKMARVPAPSISTSNFVLINEVVPKKKSALINFDHNTDASDPLATEDECMDEDEAEDSTVKQEVGYLSPKSELLSDEEDVVIPSMTECNPPPPIARGQPPKIPSSVQLLCEVCEMEFTSVGEWRDHKKTHQKPMVDTPVTDLPVQLDYPCKMCSQTFPRVADLIKHNRDYHSDINERTRAATSRKAHSCDICRKSFDLLSMLKSHEFFAHPKQTLIKCDECPKRFTNKMSLEKHIQFMHAKRDPKPSKSRGRGKPKPK